MRIGIDAHIVLPQHKRYDPKIARYTEDLIAHIIKADTKSEHTWVLFFDERTPEKVTKKFEGKNVEVRRFPFIQYRTYLPVVYSHMLISGFLRNAKLDVFHSPEGLIPFLYPGSIITTFHYVPRGKTESSLFVRTFMLGARVAFAQLCRRAKRILVNTEKDKELLVDIHGYPAERVMVMAGDSLKKVDWKKRTKELLEVYAAVGGAGTKQKSASQKESKKAAAAKKSKSATAKKTKSKK